MWHRIFNNFKSFESLDLRNFKLSLDKFKYNNRQKKFQIKLRTQNVKCKKKKK